MFAVLIFLKTFEEDVFPVKHLITVLTGIGAVYAIWRYFIRKEQPL